MTRLPALSLLVALAISTLSLAAPVKNATAVLEVAIGEPHDYHVPANAKISGPIDMPLPKWMVREGDVLKMIAPPEADTSNFVVINGDSSNPLTLEVVVKENEPTGCESDEWAEAVVDGPPMKYWNKVMDLAKKVADIEMTNIRIVPRAYADAYRVLTEKNAEAETFKGDTVIIVKSKCGEAVAPIIEELYESELFQISITHGSIPSRSARNEDENSVLSSFSETSTDEPIGEELETKKETTTLPSTTTTRHARSPSPSSAIAYVQVKAIECKQGSYCVQELDDKTFMGGKGGVNTFDITIENIGSKGGVHPWIIKSGKKRSIGVIPLQAGEHTFMLKAKDDSKQLVTSPFSIKVVADEPKNHLFKMSMFSMPSDPEYLHTMVAKLATYLKRNPDEIKIANISLDTTPKIVTFWNTSLPSTSCPTKEVSQWLRGLHTKHGEEVNADFAKAFTHHPTIHPARLEVQWMGECESAGEAEREKEEERAVKTAGGVAGSKGEEPTAKEAEGSLSILITVVCLLAVLVVLLILIVCCVACRRSKTTKGGVNEYMSKGTPVVFPDEVEDEHTDIPATAPMLVKEERPPLRVSEHSNPLYKPPPPLASTAASPRPSAAPSGHKLPPPYVPP